jgi:hypothetical protein
LAATAPISHDGQQDIAICREIGDRYGEGQTLDNLGNDHDQAACLEELAANAQSQLRVRRCGHRPGRVQAAVAYVVAGEVLDRLPEPV